MKILISSTFLKAMIISSVVISGCSNRDESDFIPAGREPVIEPDYSGVTIPVNIAPMNFKIMEEGNSFITKVKSSGKTIISVKSRDGNVIFPMKKWKSLLSENSGGKIELEIFSAGNGKKLMKFDPFSMKIADPPIDPYLYYRLLYPGYESWSEMKIVGRSTESFKETPFVDNQLLENNCINCHSFRGNQPGQCLVHVRGSRGGTYFIDGQEITRRSLKTENMKANTVYPSWHPSGQFVAFSSNKTIQSFHMQSGKNIEVSDLYSSMVIYDISKNRISGFPADDTIRYMETFPCWSSDGNFLYYCRAIQAVNEDSMRKTRYDLVKRSFDRVSGCFGKAEVIFDAEKAGKSVSFPSVSPDGKYLVLTLHDFGTFSIWHKEADLFLLNIINNEVTRLSLNSDETESYHGWSSNGKWIVFSSKRGDGLTARPYFAFFASPDSVGKPFVLPQKDPEFYRRFPKTFNRPELVKGKTDAGPRDFMRASGKPPVKAVWTGDK